MSSRSVLAAFTLFALHAQAQTYTAVGTTITDDGTVFNLPISVAGLPNELDTIDFGLETVCLSATHTWISDFEVSLVAPDGTTVLLVGGVGGDTDAFTNTCLNGNASENIAQASPPYTGTFSPQGQMGLVNNGQSGNGLWQLRVRDTYPFADEGAIVDFSLTFGNNPSPYFALHSSDLPLVIIQTDDNSSIPDEPKVHATMGIIDNGPGNVNLPTDPINDFAGDIGIETRGNSSQYLMPKKSYGFELWDDLGEDLNASLLGMPSESDWILSASYSDKSLLNNPLTFDLAQRMGHYATRWRHVNLILNGEYRGVYILMEKIKRDNDRVDIAKLDADDVAGDSITGGYILKIDWLAGNNGGGWISPYPPMEASNGQVIELLYDYPSEPLPQQAAYIQAYVDSFETALAQEPLNDTAIGYRHILDVGSAVDLLLVSELARNVDGYRLSSFLHKDKASKGGKLVMGPVWDFDLAWGNAYYCRGDDPMGWAYRFGEDCPDDGKQIPFWWARFQEDSAFVNEARCRWEELRETTLGIDRLHDWVDSLAALLNNAQAANFTVWPILGQWVWPNPDPLPTSYAGEIDELKDWISERWHWMDSHLPGACLHTGIRPIAIATRPTVLPAPFTDRFDLLLSKRTANPDVHLLDILGREVNVRIVPVTSDGKRFTLHAEGGAPGMHVLWVTAGEERWALPVLRVVGD